jgi:CHAT domain-containing protein
MSRHSEFGTRLLHARLPIWPACSKMLEQALGGEHPDVAAVLHDFALLQAAKGNFAEALSTARKVTAAVIAHALGDTPGMRYVDVTAEHIQQRSNYFRDHVRIAALSRFRNIETATVLDREAFEIAQWSTNPTAAAALHQTALRVASGTSVLAKRVRELQDLSALEGDTEKKLENARSRPEPEQDLPAIEALRGQIADIERRMAAIDVQLRKESPNYAALANSKPIPVADVQSELGTDEALVVFLDIPESSPLPEETFVWVVSKNELRWVRTGVGTKALTERVAALRCGLDAALWGSAESAKQCKVLTGSEPRTNLAAEGGKNKSIQALPFNLAQAHELYKTLFGSIAGLIKNKHLIIVPSGPLTSLPFNVLVTDPPKTEIPERVAQYRDAAWLGARTAITVLPAVSSLKALRQIAGPSQATKPYLGIGNPLLDGAQDDPIWGSAYKKRAELARTKRCVQTRQFALPHGPRPVRNFASMFRGSQVDIEQIRYQEPLPETADELCEVARRLGVANSEILLGTNATETRLKDLSEQGRLTDYVIVHFATHGALAGQVEGSAEPGLILTPPPKGTQDPKLLARDDGFLTASEIAGLKLDADWVILSACNTAGAGGESAEALSGMARAFFYAGARALLVSHWAVGSDAAVKLTTRTFAELKSHPEVGRAEALRISMKDLIENGDLSDAPPSQWAPFVVVGEGARR